MNHEHVGPEDYACDGCLKEANEGAAEDLKSRRFWGWVLVGFTLMMAAVAAFVLLKIGTGR